MGQDLSFGCQCGELTGVLADATPGSGTRIRCHCPDCRGAARHFGDEDSVKDGVEIFQTTPDRISITQGADQLALMQLSPRGLYRWYAQCCDTALFNTLAKPRMCFVGVLIKPISDPDALGKLRAEVFIPTPGGKPKHKGMALSAFGIFKRMAAANLSGKWRDTPFFDIETAAPVVAPKVISKERRAALKV